MRDKNLHDFKPPLYFDDIFKLSAEEMVVLMRQTEEIKNPRFCEKCKYAFRNAVFCPYCGKRILGGGGGRRLKSAAEGAHNVCTV